MTNNLPPEYDFYFTAVEIVSRANMADREDLTEGIRNIKTIMGTGYYDDEDGNILFQQIIDYLSKKLENSHK